MFAKKNKKKTYEHLSLHLSFHHNKKAKKGLIREILNNGDIEKSIFFSKQQNIYYSSLGYTYFSSIANMNPFSNIHILVEELMNLIS